MSGTTWSDVAVGDTVAGKGGKPWFVEDVKSVSKGAKRKVTVRSKFENKTVTHEVDPAGNATILEKGMPAIPQVDPQEAAVAVVQAVIGGEVIAEHRAADPFARVPKHFGHPGSLLAHLYVMHGLRDLPSKRAEAEALHTHNGGIGYRDHTHDL